MRKPLIGVSLIPSKRAKEAGLVGSLILKVVENGPADKVGLRETSRNNNGEIELGDIITGINDIDIKNNNDLFLALEKFAPGDKVSITYQRSGKERSVDLVLGSSIGS